MISSVAVIGLGQMGFPIARRIQAAGFQLSVCESNSPTLDSFPKGDVTICSTGRQCAEKSDIVLVLVATAEQVQEVLFGADGVASSGTTPLVVVMSTISSEIFAELAAKAETYGIDMIDAPISGGIPGAENGTLTMLCGGEEKNIALAEPVLRHIASTRIHCGSLGSAQTMKVLNNALGIANTILAGEVFSIAIRQGLDPVLLAKVLEACSGRNFRSRSPNGPANDYVNLSKTDAIFEGTQRIITKDIGLASGLAARTPGAYPGIRALQEAFTLISEETLANWQTVANSLADPPTNHKLSSSPR